MINQELIEDFKNPVKHSRGIDNIEENCHFFAYQLDDDNGICCALNFPANLFNKADYFIIQESNVIFIELTDLDVELTKIKDSIIKIDTIQNLKKEQRPTEFDYKKAKKEAWQPVINEIYLKWIGSIATIERLQKKHLKTHDPNYKMILICRNKSDKIMLTALSERLTGKIGSCPVLRSEQALEIIPEDLHIPKPES